MLRLEKYFRGLLKNLVVGVLIRDLIEINIHIVMSPLDV